METINIEDIVHLAKKQKKQKGGFPGGSVVKILPVSAGNTGSVPDLGRPHVLRTNKAHEPQLLSLCSKPGRGNYGSLCTLVLMFRDKRGHRRSEKSAQGNWGVALLQVEKSLHRKEDPAQPKIFNNNNNKIRRQKANHINYGKGDILKSEKK